MRLPQEDCEHKNGTALSETLKSRCLESDDEDKNNTVVGAGRARSWESHKTDNGYKVRDVEAIGVTVKC